jgi:hypothetical protein
MSAAKPEVGAWYQTAEDVYLEVVAYDPEEDTIELQFYDGTVEEYDSESWEELELRAAEPPEDWAGSLDMSKDDYGVDLDRPAGETFDNPLDLLDERKNDLD